MFNVPADLGHPAIDKAAKAHTELRERAERARHDAAEAGFAVERAEQQDRQDEADHVRGATKARPKPTAPAARTSAEAAGRNADVLAVAVADSERELRELVDRHREAHADKLRGQQETNREQAREQASALAAITAEGERLDELRRWCENPDKPERGHAYGIGDQLAAIDARLATHAEQVDAAVAHTANFRKRDRALTIQSAHVFAFLVESGYRHAVAREATARWEVQWRETHPQQTAPRPVPSWTA